MDKISIQVNNLRFSYGEEEVLKGIDLVLDDRATAIIGQNGAGKSTFVKLLKGLLKPSNGDIFINEINTKDTTAAKLSKHIGMVFQNPNDQIFKNKVLEEVMFGPLNLGLSKEKALDSARKALELAGLKELEGSNPYDLSLSERKLITIASIVAMDTDIIILDEPTIAQDYRGRERIKNIIRHLVSKGKLVITIIHDMDFVAEVFERTIVFTSGKIAMDGSTKEVFSKKEILKNAYLEKPHVAQLAEKLGFQETLLTVEEFINKFQSK